MSSEADVTLAQMRAEPALATVLDELSADGISMASSGDVDPTTFTLDKNYEYSLWLSYAEVYNEKAYDLLAPSSSGAGLNDSTSRIPRSTGSSAALTLSRRALAVKPSPPSDGADSDLPAGKYVAGLRHVRVRSAAEAKALVRLGQLHRQVFGTLANSQSSRSHGLVTLKLLRSHRGEADDMQAVQSARLTLVDLAGSERTKHTHTSGDRLKEAGSINKSLMVLGQCLETLRANQRRIAQSLGQSGRQDTRDAKRAQQVVPFRHSKLTEVLMDYFVGDGRVVSSGLLSRWRMHLTSLYFVGNARECQPIRYWIRGKFTRNAVLSYCPRCLDCRSCAETNHTTAQITGCQAAVGPRQWHSAGCAA